MIDTRLFDLFRFIRPNEKENKEASIADAKRNSPVNEFLFVVGVFILNELLVSSRKDGYVVHDLVRDTKEALIIFLDSLLSSPLLLLLLLLLLVKE